MESDNPRVDGPFTRVVDACVGLLILIVGVVVIVDNYRLGAGWAPDGPEAGYFPLRIGVLMALCSVIVIVHALRNKADTSIFVAWRKLIPVSQVLFPLIVYIGLMQFTGLYVASTVFVAGFMRWLGKYSWLKSCLVAVIMSVVIFWLFETQFQVPLPKGPIERWLGY
jgi:putative tricarboxylic transport membrane protein